MNLTSYKDSRTSSITGRFCCTIPRESSVSEAATRQDKPEKKILKYSNTLKKEFKLSGFC